MCIYELLNKKVEFCYFVLSDGKNTFLFFQNGGKLFLNYNLGSKDITIGDINTKVNDGRYHVVRFTRSDTNSSMQVDDNPVHTKFPQGK